MERGDGCSVISESKVMAAKVVDECSRVIACGKYGIIYAKIERITVKSYVGQSWQ